MDFMGLNDFREISKDNFETPPEKTIKSTKKILGIEDSQSEDASIEEGKRFSKGFYR